MNEVIDIYTKLIIAVISFIAPLIIYLLSMFSDGLAHVTNRTNTKIKQIDELARNSLIQEGAIMSDVVKDIGKKYENQKKELRKELNLLSPKRQIRRIFSIFFISLLLLIMHHISQNGNWFCNQNFISQNLFFICSIVSSCIGVFFLKNVAWAVINVKQELAAIHDQGKEKVETISPIDEGNGK